MAMVVLGMNDGEGFIGYINGIEVGFSSTRHNYSLIPRIGHLIIGKRAYTMNNHYASVEIDELAIWDKILSPDEIMALNDFYFPK